MVTELFSFETKSWRDGPAFTIRENAMHLQTYNPGNCNQIKMLPKSKSMTKPCRFCR